MFFFTYFGFLCVPHGIILFWVQVVNDFLNAPCAYTATAGGCIEFIFDQVDAEAGPVRGPLEWETVGRSEVSHILIGV